MGYFPTEVEEAEATTVRAGPVGRRRRVTRGDIAVLTRQLADLIGAGLPVYRALTVMAEQAQYPGVREMVEEIQRGVQAGRPLSEAVAAQERHFGSMYVNMLRAGEASGKLDAVLLRLAEFLESSHLRRAQIISSLTYPLVLVGVAFAAVTFLMLYLIPRLAEVFAEFKGALPLATVLLIGVANFSRHYWWAAAAVLAAAVLLWRRWLATEAGRRWRDRLLLELPVAGPLMQRIVAARFARALGTLLVGGVPILTSLEIAGQAVGNRLMEQAVNDVREEVRQGTPLAVSLERSGQLLPVLTHMAAVGEETGRLGDMMSRVADALDFEVETTMRRLTTLLEPLVILVMGGIVGFIVLAILLPIFRLNALIAR
jgi:type II secretory pathway component PulF